jgi:hypothetical protein
MGWTPKSYAFWILAESIWISAESAVDRLTLTTSIQAADFPADTREEIMIPTLLRLLSAEECAGITDGHMAIQSL